MALLEVNSVAQCETNDVCIMVTLQSRLHHLDSLTSVHSAHIDGLSRFRGGEIQHVLHCYIDEGNLTARVEPAASAVRQIQKNQSRITACQTKFYNLRS